jgi:hypothetical protein
MSNKFRGRLGQLDRPLLAFSILVLGVYLFYTYSFVTLTPYPGFSFTTYPVGWQVNDSFQESLPIDTILVQIADLTFEEYLQNKVSVPFAGYKPGDMVPDLITAEGESLSLEMPIPSFEDRLRRLIATLWFFPFWMAGTAILLFLRPRDMRWQLLIAFMYLAATWTVVGSIANWQVSGSQYMATIVTWLMVPIVIHLHMAVPSTIFKKYTRLLLPALYIATIILVIIEVTKSSVGPNLSVIVLAAAFIFSILILAYRSFRKVAPLSDRVSARLMLVGIGLAFGPGIFLILLPQFLGVTIPSGFALSLAFI